MLFEEQHPDQRGDRPSLRIAHQLGQRDLAGLQHVEHRAIRQQGVGGGAEPHQGPATTGVSTVRLAANPATRSPIRRVSWAMTAATIAIGMHHTRSAPSRGASARPGMPSVGALRPVQELRPVK